MQKVIDLNIDAAGSYEQTRYKAAGLAMFMMAFGHMLTRVIVSVVLVRLLNSAGLSSTAFNFLIDTIFSVIAQIIFCFLVPFLVYKKTLNLSTSQIFKESNFVKTRKTTLGLSIAIGIAGVFLGIVVGLIANIVFIMFGYQIPPNVPYHPQNFNIGLFLLSIFLIVVLPSFCEEFAMRGIFLNSMKSVFVNTTVVVILGLSFGLFHQNIRQFFPTFVAGIIMGILTIKTGSVWPAVIVHAVNNGMAVFFDYAQFYGWGNNFVDRLFRSITSLGLISVLFTAALSLTIIIPSMMAINKWAKDDKSEKKVERLYKPTIRESAFLIGALVLTAITTIFTFAFGI
ncbi:MAG: CPBP family intramembrane metalloprotease [Firmicutes bacterium]|nr:CPBP family intramembrane metalloprotease [Bacillota bacterium]